MIAKCKIQRDKRAPETVYLVRIVKIETEGIINGKKITVYSEMHLPLLRSSSSYLSAFPYI